MLSSNLRPTTRECVLLVTRDHFQSHYKDGGHTIQSAIAENPMLHANFVALCFVELELLPIKVLHCGNINFRPFCFCDLDLNPMTFIYELDLYSLELYHMCIVKAFESYHLTDRQTDSTEIIYHASSQVVSCSYKLCCNCCEDFRWRLVNLV